MVRTDWLSAGGEVGHDLRAIDWSHHPLGSPECWPASLRTTVSTLLASRFSMWMAWGPELTFFCNDAYRRDTLGTKYPWALGRPASEVWSEIWPEIGPRVETVLETGQATWDESLLLFLERSGYVEETYHTFSYSPLPDDDGCIAGMLCVVTEETERVILARRTMTLRDIGNVSATAGDERDFLRAAAGGLATNYQSLPFTASYLFDENGGAELAATTHLPPGHPVAPARIAPGEASLWPVADLLAQREVVVDGLPAELPGGVSDYPPHQGFAVPIRQVGERHPYGFLAVGINQHRPDDESYRAFIRLIAQRLGAGVAEARSLRLERLRSEQLAELARVRRQAAEELQGKSERLEEALAQLLRSQQLIAAQRDILALIAQGAPLESALAEIVRWVELISEHGARASVLLLSEDGRTLRHGAAPSLPAAYNGAIDGIAIGPAVGSCGTAAHRREPVIVQDISTDELWADFRALAAEHGLRSCWSVPIAAADGRLVGTFALYHDHPRRPTEDDMRAVELLARTAAVAIERSRDVAARTRQLAELQSSLLPRALPQVPGIGLAAAFRPGDRSLEVGGDFYDVFELSPGCWGFIVGDVCGHGAEAAAVTALTRHTARAIAPLRQGPAVVLRAVSDALRRSGYDRFCTAVYGRLDAPPGEPVRVELASGGHPAPLVRRAGGTVEVLGDHGPLLGIFDAPEFPVLRAELAPDDALMLYTDGLVERNPQLPDGDALATMLSDLAAPDAGTLLAGIERAIPGAPAAGRDDVAILVLRVDQV